MVHQPLIAQDKSHSRFHYYHSGQKPSALKQRSARRESHTSKSLHLRQLTHGYRLKKRRSKPRMPPHRRRQDPVTVAKCTVQTNPARPSSSSGSPSRTAPGRIKRTGQSAIRKKIQGANKADLRLGTARINEHPIRCQHRKASCRNATTGHRIILDVTN